MCLRRSWEVTGGGGFVTGKRADKVDTQSIKGFVGKEREEKNANKRGVTGKKGKVVPEIKIKLHSGRGAYHGRRWRR